MKKLLFTIMFLSLTTNGYCADQWAKTQPLGTAQINNLDTLIGTNNEALDRVLSGLKQGSILTYGSGSSITVTAGQIVCSNSAGTIRKLRSNTSSTAVTFANIDAGAEAASTTYYVWAVSDTDITGTTFMVSLSSTAPTGATYYAKLGSFYNDAASNITQINNDNLPDFGIIISRSNATSYQATTDGFVMASSAVGGENEYQDVEGYTDSVNPPTTNIVGSSMTIGAGYNKKTSIMFPVMAGDYWKVTGATTVYWRPINY